MVKNNLKRRNYSIIIVSDATSSSKEITISSKFIRKSLLAVSILLLVFGFMIFDYMTLHVDKQKMRRLERENQTNNQKIQELNATVNELSANLKKMEEVRNRILVAAGLDSPHALEEVGSGGPGSIPDTGITRQKPNVRRERLLTPADELLNASRKDLEGLENVASSLDQQKIRWACSPTIWPTDGYISTDFGMRINPFTGKREMHAAIDISTQLGRKIVAPADGLVVVVDKYENYGNIIIIDHGFGYSTRYGHLSNVNVREGQRVKRYDVIGFVGNTGRSTGPHVHYEVRLNDKPVNPRDLVLDKVR